MRKKLYNWLPEKIRKNKIFNNIFVLASGTFIANLFTVLASPLLSRLYDPAEFGILGGILSITTVVTVIGSLKYELAIVIEKDREKALELKRLCLYILIINSVLFLSGIFVFSKIFRTDLGSNYLSVLYVAGLLVLIEGYIQVQSYWFNRENKFGVISKSRIVQRTGIIAAQLSAFKLDHWGLLSGRIIGGISSQIYFKRNLEISDKKKFSFSLKNLFSLIKKHKKFALFSSPQNLLNSLSQNTPVYFLTLYFGLEVVGWYWFSKRLLQMPLGILSNAIGQVLYREIADSSGISNTRRLHLKATRILLAAVILPVILVFVLSPFLFPYIFGDEWTEAGVFARWIIIYSGLGIIISPSVAVINSHGLQKFYMFYELFWLLVRVVILYISCTYFNYMLAIILDSLAGASYCIFLPLFVYIKLRKNE